MYYSCKSYFSLLPTEIFVQIMDYFNEDRLVINNEIYGKQPYSILQFIKKYKYTMLHLPSLDIQCYFHNDIDYVIVKNIFGLREYLVIKYNNNKHVVFQDIKSELYENYENYEDYDNSNGYIYCTGNCTLQRCYVKSS